jgi:hypothetical protein
MNNETHRAVDKIVIIVGIVIACTAIIYLIMGVIDRNAKYNTANSQVLRWVETLDSETDEFGLYQKHPNGDIAEQDPWGTGLKVLYTPGSFMETLKVASAGPDQTFYTPDDIWAKRRSTNLKGLGKNIESVAHGGSKGMVTGVVDGVKESFGRNKKELTCLDAACPKLKVKLSDWAREQWERECRNGQRISCEAVQDGRLP